MKIPKKELIFMYKEYTVIEHLISFQPAFRINWFKK